MATPDPSVILYITDLDSLRGWVGANDRARYEDALETLGEDEDTGWEPETLAALLRRVVLEGRLYEELDTDDRYAVSQILIDLFDEYGDHDALSEELPLKRLAQALEALPRGGEAARLAAFLTRGRELNSDRLLWESGPVERTPTPFLGYVRRDEAPRLAAELDDFFRNARERPSGLLKQLRSAAHECAQAEMDLVSYVG